MDDLWNKNSRVTRFYNSKTVSPSRSVFYNVHRTSNLPLYQIYFFLNKHKLETALKKHLKDKKMLNLIDFLKDTKLK